MDGVKLVLLVQELKPRHVPDDVAGFGLDREFLERGNEPLPLLIEVAGVGERQGLPRLPEHRLGEFGRWLALGMEVTRGRGDGGGRRRRGIAIEHVGGHGEGRNALHELASGRHRSAFVPGRMGRISDTMSSSEAWACWRAASRTAGLRSRAKS